MTGIYLDELKAQLHKEGQVSALREAADALPHLTGTQITRQQAAAAWLRDRADSIELAYVSQGIQ